MKSLGFTEAKPPDKTFKETHTCDPTTFEEAITESKWRSGGTVMQSAAGIFISQKKYVLEILDRFQMKNCNSVSTPTEVGLKIVRDPEGRKVDNTVYKQIGHKYGFPRKFCHAVLLQQNPDLKKFSINMLQWS
ncbi:hypothetical protein CR513_26715, partial [Mucuna pruriens]